MSSPIDHNHEESKRRPMPGPAGVRPIWDGQQEAMPKEADPETRKLLGPATLRWSSDRAFGADASSKRIEGIDAARGLALLGMIAIHTLPAPVHGQTDDNLADLRWECGRAVCAACRHFCRADDRGK